MDNDQVNAICFSVAAVVMTLTAASCSVGISRETTKQVDAIAASSDPIRVGCAINAAKVGERVCEKLTAGEKQ